MTLMRLRTKTLENYTCRLQAKSKLPNLAPTWLSAKGAKCDSLGQRPRITRIIESKALKARNRTNSKRIVVILNSIAFEKFAVFVLKRDSLMMQPLTGNVAL